MQHAKKSQLTLLFILALVLLVAFGIIFYLNSRSAETSGASEVRERELDVQLIKPVTDYVTGCLKLGVEESLIELGKQAGHLDAMPGQLNSPIYALSYENRKLPYLLLPPIGRVGEGENILFSSTPPIYPHPSFPLRGEQEYMVGYFGRSALSLLEGSNTSWQKQLEYDALPRVLDCLDWTPFEAQGLSIVPQEQAMLAIDIPEDGIRATLEYPLEVTSRRTGTNAKRDTFVVAIPVRIRLAHEVLQGIIDSDATNASYNVTGVEHDGVRASILTDVYGPSDVYVVEDTQSIIQGLPFIIVGGRANRLPALHNTPQELIDDDVKVKTGTTISWFAQTLLLSNICVGEEKSFTFSATDPDEETVSFAINRPDSITLTDGDIASASSQGYNITVFAYDSSTNASGCSIENTKCDWQTLSFLTC